MGLKRAGARVVVLAALAVALGAPASSASSASSAPARTAATAGRLERVRVAISVSATDGLPSTTLTITVPPGGPGTAAMTRLRATPLGASRAYRDALSEVLGANGLFDPREAIPTFIDNLDALPALTVSGGTATVTATARGVLGIPQWNIGRDSTRLTLEPIRVPVTDALRIDLTPGRSRVVAASQLPAEESAAGPIVWSFAPGSTAAIRLSLKPGLFAPPVRQTAGPAIASFLVFALPFAIFLIFCVDRRPPAAEDPALVQLARLSRIMVALAIGAAVSFALFEVDWETVRHWLGLGPRARDVLQQVAPAVAPALVLVPLLALHRSRWKPLALAVLGLLVALEVLVGKALTLDLARAEAQPTASGAHAAIPASGWPYAVSACAVGAVLLALTLTAWARWAAATVPEAGEWWRRHVTPAWGWLLVALLAATMILQLVLSCHAQSHQFATEMRSVFPGARTTRSAGTAFSAVLTSVLANLPGQLANLALVLFTVVLGVALAASLRRGLGEQPEPRFGGWQLALRLALLFGSAVIGTGGAIHNYAAPIAFLIGFAAVALVLRALSRRRRAQLVGDLGLRRAAPALLARAERIALLSPQSDALAAELSTGGISEADYEDRQIALRARLRALADAPGIVGLVPPRDRPRELRALGLAASADVNRRLARLARRGWWAIAVPVGYTLYTVLERNAPGAFSAQQPLGAPFLIVSALGQAVLWPIAVWCFVLTMPILPGTTGLVRALWAAAAFIVPSALAAPMIDQPHGTTGGWLFTAALIALVFIVVAVFLDYRTVRRIGLRLRQLGELYRITSLRAAIAYIAPLLVLLFTVIQELRSGHAPSALGDLASHASALVPGPH